MYTKILVYLVQNHNSEKRGLSFTLSEVQEFLLSTDFPLLLKYCQMFYLNVYSVLESMNEQGSTEESSYNVAPHFLMIASRLSSFWERQAPKQEIMKLCSKKVSLHVLLKISLNVETEV